ncbi:response regulator [Paenibacillus monticola]|uniref:Response regulator n=1 Tax=Paenibacillus monticola TaxID=2666075 RepID=A0A7X2L139_9BACL|nr:response regulator [Paenibacillus monticola]MRN51936.1 response regulator [Paenibacillus monticola]
MIQALLVDDERLALMKLKLMLEELTTVHIVAAYTDPSEAVIAAPQIDPDVIFLDIDMPEMNGMQAADIMQELCPRADIVFVTAYNNYATEAFELNALDYILKPVRRDRLLKTVRKLEDSLAMKAQHTKPTDEIMIRCFQTLRFERGELLLPSIRWRTSKAQEMFAYLFHNRNRFVSKDLLFDILWPEFNVKKAATHLYTTIYQVRQCLKQGGIDELQISTVSGGEGYMLVTKKILIDTVEWENGILSLEPIVAGNSTKHQKLFELYTGDYYGDYDYLWAESERQRLRTIWLHHAMRMADFFIGEGRIPEAVTIYQRIVQLQPYFEQGHMGLMRIYDQTGERSAVEEQYRLLSDLLNRELSIELPANIEAWYTQWKLGSLKYL